MSHKSLPKKGVFIGGGSCARAVRRAAESVAMTSSPYQRPSPALQCLVIDNKALNGSHVKLKAFVLRAHT